MKNNMQEHIPVFFEGQDDLIDILATSMCSICYNTKSFIDFYILDCGIHEFNKKQLESLKEKFDNFSIKYIPIDLKQFEGLKGYGRLNFVDCYSRLLIPELVPELDKAIYLDTDIIVLGDIELLWKEDINNYNIAGVLDIAYGNINWVNNVPNSPRVGEKFLNAGVLLIDCKNWRKNNISKKILELARKYKEYIGAVCEDLLSTYFNKNFKILDFKYGYSSLPSNGEFCSIPSDYIINGKKNAIIIHFSGDTKPWKNQEHTIVWNKEVTVFMWKSFWFFAEMTPFFTSLKLRFLEDTNTYFTNILRNDIYNAVNILKSNFENSNKILPNNKGTVIYKILNIPFIVKKGKLDKKCYKLFNILPLMKIKVKSNKKIYKLFGFIPLLTIKNK